MENEYRTPSSTLYVAPTCTPETDSKLTGSILEISSMGQGRTRIPTREEAMVVFSHKPYDGKLAGSMTERELLETEPKGTTRRSTEKEMRAVFSHKPYVAPTCTPQVDSQLTEIVLEISSMGQGRTRIPTREEAIKAFP